MEATPSIFDALKYGTIGLCAVLTYFAYLLLSKEQAKTDPRPHLLREIRLFMTFALASLSVGLFSQLPMFRSANSGGAKQLSDADNKKQPEAVAAHFTYTREGVNGFGTAFMEFDNSGHANMYLVNQVTSTQLGEGDVGAAKFHITRSDASR